MDLTSLINDIAAFFKKKPPTPNSDGRFSITFDDKYEVLFFQEKNEKDGIYLSGFIASNPLDPTPENTDLLKYILQVNFARQKESNETLTWDPTSNKLMLYKKVYFKDLSEKPIIEHLEEFLNNQQMWTDIVKNGPNASQASSSPFSIKFP